MIVNTLMSRVDLVSKLRVQKAEIHFMVEDVETGQFFMKKDEDTRVVVKKYKPLISMRDPHLSGVLYDIEELAEQVIRDMFGIVKQPRPRYIIHPNIIVTLKENKRQVVVVLQIMKTGSQFSKKYKLVSFDKDDWIKDIARQYGTYKKQFRSLWEKYEEIE